MILASRRRSNKGSWETQFVAPCLPMDTPSSTKPLPPKHQIVSAVIFHQLSIWRFPEIGVPPNHPFFFGISHSKSSIWGEPHVDNVNPVGAATRRRPPVSWPRKFNTEAYWIRMPHGSGVWMGKIKYIYICMYIYILHKVESIYWKIIMHVEAVW